MGHQGSIKYEDLDNQNKGSVKQKSNSGFTYKSKKNSQVGIFQQYDDNKKPLTQQLKNNLIQMRKVNPISKTTNNNSQHTSVEKHKSNSIGTSM